MDGKTMKNAVDETGNQTHILSVIGHPSKRSYAPKNAGALPVAGGEEQKRTNETGMAIPVLAVCDMAGKDITGDALLAQRAIATYVVEQKADYHFTVKGNQPGLEGDIALLLETRGEADIFEVTPPDHGRIETRSIWCSTALNDYQTGGQGREIALGLTSRTQQ